MVIVSEAMKKNFKSYGDILSFDITYKLIKNTTSDDKRYRLGVFCVTDTNLRILLAGLAIICDETVNTMYKIFQFFFEIHRKQPDSIITDQQGTIETALELQR